MRLVSVFFYRILVLILLEVGVLVTDQAFLKLILTFLAVRGVSWMHVHVIDVALVSCYDIFEKFLEVGLVLFFNII